MAESHNVEHDKYPEDTSTAEDKLRARVASLERLKDKLVECNAIARELGFDTAMDGLLALRTMLRGGAGNG